MVLFIVIAFLEPSKSLKILAAIMAGISYFKLFVDLDNYGQVK